MAEEDKTVKVTVELPAWLLRRATQDSRTKDVLQSEVGREVVARGIRGTRK